MGIHGDCKDFQGEGKWRRNRFKMKRRLGLCRELKHSSQGSTMKTLHLLNIYIYIYVFVFVYIYIYTHPKPKNPKP